MGPFWNGGRTSGGARQTRTTERLGRAPGATAVRLVAINEALTAASQIAVGRAEAASAGIVDSQAVKTTENGGPRGYDAGKKVWVAVRSFETSGCGKCVTAGGCKWTESQSQGPRGPHSALHTLAEGLPRPLTLTGSSAFRRRARSPRRHVPCVESLETVARELNITVAWLPG